MGHQRKRKSSNHRRKFDPVIVSLASLSVMLLIAWGILYWKDNSEKSLQRAIEANQKTETNLVVEKELHALPGMDAASVEAGDNNETEALEEAGVTDKLPEASVKPSDKENLKPTAPSTTQPTAPSNSQPEATSTIKPTAPSTSQPEATSTTKPTTPSTTKPTAPSASQPEAPSTTQPTAPSTAQPEAPSAAPETAAPAQVMNKEEQYEQEIVKVQAGCTKDMNEILNGAKLSLETLDKGNPVVVMAWKEELMNKLSTASHTCDVQFDMIMQNAEEDEVSSATLEDWIQQFNRLKEEQARESEAKLQQLLVG